MMHSHKSYRDSLLCLYYVCQHTNKLHLVGHKAVPHIKHTMMMGQHT